MGVVAYPMLLPIQYKDRKAGMILRSPGFFIFIHFFIHANNFVRLNDGDIRTTRGFGRYPLASSLPHAPNTRLAEYPR